MYSVGPKELIIRENQVRETLSNFKLKELDFEDVMAGVHTAAFAMQGKDPALSGESPRAKIVQEVLKRLDTSRLKGDPISRGITIAAHIDRQFGNSATAAAMKQYNNTSYENLISKIQKQLEQAKKLKGSGILDEVGDAPIELQAADLNPLIEQALSLIGKIKTLNTFEVSEKSKTVKGHKFRKKKSFGISQLEMLKPDHLLDLDFGSKLIEESLKSTFKYDKLYESRTFYIFLDISGSMSNSFKQSHVIAILLYACEILKSVGNKVILAEYLSIVVNKAVFTEYDAFKNYILNLKEPKGGDTNIK
ncbi:MAG: hypothetical protein ACRDBG_27660, partial [Waterburya sp.]